MRFKRLLNYLLRGSVRHPRYCVFCKFLRAFPVLAEGAVEIAPMSGNAHAGSSGLKMEQWLFFYWVYCHCKRSPINKAVEPALYVFAHSARACQTIRNHAEAPAHKAMHFLVCKFFI